jgi:hypothetical protein
VNAYVYIEGGASGPHSKNLTIRCQQAFHKLLDGMGFKGRKPRLKACGGRDSVYEDFCTAHRVGPAGYVAMWIVAVHSGIGTFGRFPVDEGGSRVDGWLGL